jgi:Multiubiquitin
MSFTLIEVNSMITGYKVCIDDVDYSINDPIVTGQQMLDLATKRPAVEFLVFQFLKNGQLESIRLDETTDLRKPEIERFLTFKSDRAFSFTLDGRRFEWGEAKISGLWLKKLAQVDPASYGVWQEIKGKEDRLIGNGDFADLTTQGVERFFTGKQTTTEG